MVHWAPTDAGVWTLDSVRLSLWGICCLLGSLTAHGSHISQCEGDLGTITQISILMANKFDERITFTVDSESEAHGENRKTSVMWRSKSDLGWGHPWDVAGHPRQ